MKTSNKILIGLLVLALGLVGITLTTIHYQYDQGYFTLAAENSRNTFTRIAREKPDLLIVKELDQVTIIPADSFSIELEKGKQEEISLSNEGSSLILSNNSQSRFAPVRIYVPTNQKIKAINCSLILWGSPKVFQAMSFQFDLAHSRLSTPSISDDTRFFQYIDVLSVSGSDSSELRILDWTSINHLKLDNLVSVVIEPVSKVEKMELNFTSVDQLHAISSREGIEIRSRQ